jgi:hypothetical protein
VCSKRLNISCTGIVQGRVFLPMQIPNTAEELFAAIERVRSNPLLHRFMSLDLVLLLRDRLKGVESIGSIEDRFPSPELVTHQVIADYAVELLLRLHQATTRAGPAHARSLLESACAPSTAALLPALVLEEMLGTQAHHYLSGALYASMDPLEAAFRASEALKRSPSGPLLWTPYLYGPPLWDSLYGTPSMDPSMGLPLWDSL